MPNPTVIPGIHLLFRRYNTKLGENEYLLHKRINTKFFDGHYSVPGGHIDDYETPIECAAREAMEELGVSVEQPDIQFVNVIHRIKPEDKEVRIDYCFVVEKWTGEISNQEPHKHSDVAWHVASKLPQPMKPYVQSAILDVEKSATFTLTYI